jgi:hypothetical protein
MTPRRALSHTDPNVTPQRPSCPEPPQYEYVQLRRPQTIDQVADDGLLGAVLIGEARSEEYIEERRVARERVFAGVEPAVAGASPYNCRPRRGGGAFRSPLKEGRVEWMRTPSQVPMRTARPRLQPSTEERARSVRQIRKALTSAFASPGADCVLRVHRPDQDQ